MTFAEYLTIPAINWSTLKELKRSPKHYRYRLANKLEDSTRLALGRAAHTAVLEPDRFALDYAVYEGKRRAGKEWDAFEEANASKTVLKVDEYTNILAVRDAVRAHPAAAAVLAGAKTEQTLEWTERINGVDLKCKARPDAIGTVISDLKTCRDASAGPFGRTAASYGYHTQLSWYRRAAWAALGVELPMKLIAVELEAPHDVCVYDVDADAAWAADEEINDLLGLVASCTAANYWPGASDTEVPLALPHWVFGNQESITDDDDIVFGHAKGE
jgi:hypothetical protein